MYDTKTDPGTGSVKQKVSCTTYIVCEAANAACAIESMRNAKCGPVSGCLARALCGAEKGGMWMVLPAACPPAHVEKSDIMPAADSTRPVRILSDLYGRCYKKWGMFTAEVNELLGVANTSDITDPQAAWEDILAFRYQEMLE